MTDIGRDPRGELVGRSATPVVPLPRAGLSGAAIAFICAVLGLLLFLMLDSNRRAAQQSPGPTAAQQPLAAPPPLAIPPAPPSVVVSAPIPAQAPPSPPLRPGPPPSFVPAPLPSSYAAPPPPIPMAGVAPTASSSGANNPALVLDFTSGGGVAVAGKAEGEDGGAAAGDDQAVRASIIRNRSSLVSQGTLIAAVLETPINSSRAGLVRAIVSQDVRGFDGTRVLIPRGSRLIGEAKGDAKPGQRRVLVTWTRLIRPDGVAIRIGSPGADSLGGTGLAGSVDTHFLERFGNAVLQSTLAIGVNLASRPKNGSVIVGLPTQVGSTLGQTPVFDVPSGPTIKVPQGAQIAIFVARDLDFGGVAPRS